MRVLGALVTCALLAWACVAAKEPTSGEGLRRYQEDLDLLRAHLDVVELADASGEARVAVVPAYQGRVMTSSAGGPDGWSLGWINAGLIASGETLAHINPYGGEDRLWFGPEGGSSPSSSRRARPSTSRTGRRRRWSTPSRSISWPPTRNGPCSVGRPL